MSGNKRPADEAASSATGAPAAKKMAIPFDTLPFGKLYSLVSTSLEELDMKVLVFQNKKLAERIEQRKKAETELKKRIEQLENRQRTDDAVLMIVNRYWNQLDEDVRVLLQRFDAETSDETETKNESSELTSFLTLLSTWDKQELEEKLGQRVEFSKRAIGKLLQAFDRLLQRNEKLHHAIDFKVEQKEKDGHLEEEAKGDEDKEEKEEKKEEGNDEEEDNEKKKEGEENKEKPSKSEEGSTEVKNDDEKEDKVPEPSLFDIVKGELADLKKEAKQLQNLVTQLHQRHHEHTLHISELQDKLTASETEIAELKNKLDDLDYMYDKSECKKDSLERQLAEVSEKLQFYQETTGNMPLSGLKNLPGVPTGRLDEILSELEEHKELSSNRLMELEKLSAEYQETLTQVEKLKMDLQHLPENVILETTEYKCLQSQFSVLYNESMQIRTQLEEIRNQMTINKNNHGRQIEQMEAYELEGQKKLRTEMILVEDSLAQTRKEYDMLRIEFEQAMAANDQNLTINREMRNLIQSLQNHNQQLKMESARYKRRLREAQTEIHKLKQELAVVNPPATSTTTGTATTTTTTLSSTTPATATTSVTTTSSSSPAAVSTTCAGDNKDGIVHLKEEVQLSPVKTEPGSTPSSMPPLQTIKKEEGEMMTTPIKKEEEDDYDLKDYKNGKNDPEMIKDLRNQLKKSQDNVRELKLLLDTYKAAPKEQREKVQLMAAEKKARQEVDDLKGVIKRMQDSERRERRKLADEDAMRKIKKMEETIIELQKNLANQKQREEALLNDLDVTGQAFEDMQEQNTRLLQQLREKDDANFKLMSERIKSNQIQKLLREEKDVLTEQVATLQTQVEAQNLVVRSLEEKERLLQNSLAAVEKEQAITQQAMEMHKRKAVESSQTAADLKLHLDKYQAQLKEAQVAVAEKTASLEQEVFKYKRMQEEVAKLNRKLERSKKIEMAGAADEVLLEEIKEYKEQLTCPSCKVNKKDAVLTKCFHVFCLECLRTRYETRQRKCPKCNAGFGANDFHRLYLS
ncbi:E3 ubiquitin-protein ligase Bre1-like [Biomphalaria glabrata]|uniref:E3 ubiquitin protein ligase n=1 Tax=Biomphalaria glabrata TaxID=6526 RepID=A0A9W2YH49_BIOGL|nr:E3 ubiquitin-protein ligase Bre1-like [Biomphalaria glabrata]